MALSNTAVPKYYGMFRDAVIRGEIIDNKPIIIDCQIGKKFDSLESFAEYANSAKYVEFARLDNIDLNEDFLLRWLRNA